MRAGLLYSVHYGMVGMGKESVMGEIIRSLRPHPTFGTERRVLLTREIRPNVSKSKLALSVQSFLIIMITCPQRTYIVEAGRTAVSRLSASRL